MPTISTTIHSLSVGMILLAALPSFAAPAPDAVITDRSRAVVDSRNECVRTRFMLEGDVCAPQAEMQVTKRSWLQEERTIYFAFNTAYLDAQAKQKIDTLARVLTTDDQVKQARIVGYADRMGQPSYNEQLSRRRAGAVRQYMVSRGFVKASVAQTRWVGEKDSISSCEENLPRDELISCLQNDRRVEIEIDYLTEPNATE